MGSPNSNEPPGKSTPNDPVSLFRELVCKPDGHKHRGIEEAYCIAKTYMDINEGAGAEIVERFLALSKGQ